MAFSLSWQSEDCRIPLNDLKTGKLKARQSGRLNVGHTSWMGLGWVILLEYEAKLLPHW